MRWMIVALLLGTAVASAKPRSTSAGRPASIIGQDGVIVEDFACVPATCADGELALVAKARALAAELKRRSVRFAPTKALSADWSAHLQAYGLAVRAYDAVACCSAPTGISVAALCERGALTDAHREIMESLPAPTDRADAAIAWRQRVDEGWRVGTLREATCAYRAAARLAKRIGHDGEDLARARMAQRADEALLSAIALRAGREPKLDDATLNCPADPSQLSSVWVD